MNEKILEIDNLTVNFDGFKALNQLNFSMDTGELRVIIGPNGAGKTTFLDVITGKVQPTEGRVLFKGKNLRNIPEYRISRLGIGRKFQTPRVYLNLTVRENLDLVANSRKNVFHTLFGKGSSAERRSIAGLLETIGLISKADLQAAFLAHGEKQRLEIGMLVAQSPDLLLVDEPVAGLTDEETENVGNLLLALAENHSIIVIEHDMEFVRQIARKVTVLHQGSVLCEGTMDQIQDDPKVIEVYLGKETSLTPQQIRMLRIISIIAWSDGLLNAEEENLIIEAFNELLSLSEEQKEQLREDFSSYAAKNVDLEILTDQIEDLHEKELILNLAYQIIKISSPEPETTLAYQKLTELLNLAG